MDLIIEKHYNFSFDSWILNQWCLSIKFVLFITIGPWFSKYFLSLKTKDFIRHQVQRQKPKLSEKSNTKSTDIKVNGPKIKLSKNLKTKTTYFKAYEKKIKNESKFSDQ